MSPWSWTSLPTLQSSFYSSIRCIYFKYLSVECLYVNLEDPIPKHEQLIISELFLYFLFIFSMMHVGFPHSSVGKESPAIQETLVQFLDQEDSLEKG